MSDDDRYYYAAHAMQSGVAMKMNYDPTDTEPKHLRVGVNASMVDHGGLVALLIEKGIMSREEYMTAIADQMENEKSRYEKELSMLTGAKVTLR